MLTRRRFLQRSAQAAALGGSARAMFGQHSMQMAMPMSGAGHDVMGARPLLDLAKVTPFVAPLPIPPVAKPVGTHADPDGGGGRLPYYAIHMRETQQLLHPSLPPTRVWGYGAAGQRTSFPGPTIVAHKNEAIAVRWSNDLPRRHFLPIDHNICGAEADKPEVRSVTHVHGARVPHAYDGFPENWFVPGQSALYRYGNPQDAATLWYHDHAMGLNRLNSYAGMMGFYLLRDEAEEQLGLPSGRYEVPLVICDRMIDREAQLFYPVSGDPKAPWVPEFFGNVVLANGAIWPRFDAEPKPYRFRLLNASNGRFLRLHFSGKQSFLQIGTDQGLMASPLETQELVLAPGERADVVLDLGRYAGETFTLSDQLDQILQISVASGDKQLANLPTKLSTLGFLDESAAVRTRTLTLHELDDYQEQPMKMLLDNKMWHDPVSERMRNGDVEIWNLVNTTADSHPIHLHLVRMQILDRRNIEPFYWLEQNRLVWVNDTLPPDPTERGWKDVARVEPQAVTRLLIKFDGWPGRYAWHCHLLEHEANEMMRPFEIYA